MRERITFVHGADGAFDPKQLRVEGDTLQLQSLKAAREDRLTFSFPELPQEVLESMSCNELAARLTLDLALANPEAISRVAPPMDVARALYLDYAFRFTDSPRIAYIFDSAEEPLGVCKRSH